MDIGRKLPDSLLELLDWVYLKAKQSNPDLTEELFWEIVVEKFLDSFKKEVSPLQKNKVVLHNRLKEALRLRGKTQTHIANEIGINRAYVSQIINGRYEPSITLALLFSQSLGVSIEELFFLEPAPEE